MNGPFRDDLAAAHAKIAQLEAEIHDLKSDPFRPPPPAIGIDPAVLRRRQHLLLVAVSAGTGIMLLVGLVAFCLFASRAPAAPTATSSPAFSGIAIAPTPQSAQTAAPASPAVDKQNPSASAKPSCNCTPGDPLCSCL